LIILGLNAYGVDFTDFYGHSDADMLEIGNGGLNHQQERSHFALWAAMKSPLLIGTNLEHIKASSLELLKSKTLLAFNQDDRYGKPAKPFRWDRTFRLHSPPQYWSGKFQGGVMALVLNNNETARAMGFTWDESPDLEASKTYRLVDGWNGVDYGCYARGVNITSIKPYDTAVLILIEDCSTEVQSSGQLELRS
jgi:alpha-galactosidase